MATLLTRDLRPDGSCRLTLALTDGTIATVVQPRSMVDDPSVWEALDHLVTDRALRRAQADRELIL